MRECIADALPGLGGDLEVVHSLLLCPFLRLIVGDLTIWKITLVAEQAPHNWSVNTVVHDLEPFLKIFERLPGAQVENQERTGRSLEEYVGYTVELFLAKSVPDMQLCTFLRCARDFLRDREKFLVDLDLRAPLLVFFEVISNIPLSNRSLPNS